MAEEAAVDGLFCGSLSLQERAFTLEMFFPCKLGIMRAHASWGVTVILLAFGRI